MPRPRLTLLHWTLTALVLVSTPALVVWTLTAGHDPAAQRAALAHAHGNLLGILCLLLGANAERLLPEESRPGVARWLGLGAIAMPLGFLLGGVLNHEGDPSLFVLLVPAGGVSLMLAMVQALRTCRT